MSPALAGGFLTTAPPGKSCRCIFDVFVGRKVTSTSFSSDILKVLQSWFFFFFFLIYLFIYLFLAVLGLRFCARAFSSCGEWGPLFIAVRRPLTIMASLVGSTGSRCAGSAVVAHGPSCSAARGIFPDQGSNPCPLHWQADSQQLHHQGSPNHGSLCTISGHSFWSCEDQNHKTHGQIHSYN